MLLAANRIAAAKIAATQSLASNRFIELPLFATGRDGAREPPRMVAFACAILIVTVGYLIVNRADYHPAATQGHDRSGQRRLLPSRN
jgi:hypothetical protein